MSSNFSMVQIYYNILITQKKITFLCHCAVLFTRSSTAQGLTQRTRGCYWMLHIGNARHALQHLISELFPAFQQLISVPQATRNKPLKSQNNSE